jgi:hypothetical protein
MPILKKGSSMKTSIPILLFYILFLCSGSPLHAQENRSPVGEKTLSVGAASTWAAVEGRSGITALTHVRPWPVLALSSGRPSRTEVPDLAISFDQDAPELFTDQTGRYAITTAQPGAGLSTVGPRWARMGEGAVFFSAAAAWNDRAGGEELKAAQGSAGPLVIHALDPQALLAPDRHVRDFSLEFWLYPLGVENGEQILSWTASRPKAVGSYYFQRIQCAVVKNRLQWNFHDFFTASGGEGVKDISLNGSSPVVPKIWSHHLIRFDADTGLLEYLVNGRTEALVYTTESGAEGGNVYTPITGIGGELILGKGYTGLMDEFRIHDRYAGQTGREFSVEGSIQKYPAAGGRIETRALDLGLGSSDILRLEALGGRITLAGNQVRNDYAGQGEFRFSDNSTAQFFMRAGDNPYRWTDADWQVVTPGIALPPVFQGRYVQLAAVLYPSADGETSPYLEELRIVYRPNEPPRPPSRLTAIARDGAVELSWRHSPSTNLDGYRVYYGSASGEYFGSVALQGASPIDAGKRSALRIEGLDNGALYYFAVVSYARGDNELREGEFSREVTARPLLEYTTTRYERGP